MAAGQASGAKRKANAMSKEESLLRKAAHKREVRAQKAAALKERCDMREQQLADRAAAVISASESAAVATVEPPPLQAMPPVRVGGGCAPPPTPPPPAAFTASR